jgi:hypothetical protein
VSGLPTLDISGVFQSTIGTRVGIKQPHFRAAKDVVLTQHAALEEAAQGGLLPHLLPLPVSEARRLAASLSGRPVVLLAEPSAGLAVSALSSSHGVAPVLLDATDARSIEDAVALEGAVLVVLDGPAWVRLVAAELGPLFSTVLVFAGDGTGASGWGPSGSQVVESFGSADLRFGGFGLAALTLLAAAGGDLEGVAATAAAMAEQCRSSVMSENPSYALAAVFLALEEVSGISGPMLLVPSRRLQSWGQWLSGSWGATAIRPELRGGLRRVRGESGRCVLAGDEAAIQRLIEGPADRLIVSVVGSRPPGPDRAIGRHLSAWSLGQAFLGAHHHQLRRTGRPMAQLRTSSLGPSSMLACAVLWTQAALAVGGSRGQDPLTMDAADGWRGVLVDSWLPTSSFGDV